MHSFVAPALSEDHTPIYIYKHQCKHLGHKINRVLPVAHGELRGKVLCVQLVGLKILLQILYGGHKRAVWIRGKLNRFRSPQLTIPHNAFRKASQATAKCVRKKKTEAWHAALQPRRLSRDTTTNGSLRYGDEYENVRIKITLDTTSQKICLLVNTSIGAYASSVPTATFNSALQVSVEKAMFKCLLAPGER